jgi:4-hydroxythreonine-4-phosphate dehydrogenase
MSVRPVIAITIGDINGIGPEIILKALSQKELRSQCRPIILAPKTILMQQLQILRLDFEVINIDVEVEIKSEPGKMSAISGQIAGRALEMAIDRALKKTVDAIVTAPISKTAFNLAGYDYPGHTEFLAARTRTKDYVMVLLDGNFRVGLVTTHCPISKVPKLLSTEKILSKLRTLNHDLIHRFSIDKPKIAVSALNPHGGERGMFGSEEQEIIIPAINMAKEFGIDVQGPFPADSLFAHIEHDKYDAYLAMYHDQGLIPLKMKSFGKAVNYTAGLPIIRTSPDHGTAFDITGKGVADPGSMVEAIKLAISMANKTKGS